MSHAGGQLCREANLLTLEMTAYMWDLFLTADVGTADVIMNCLLQMCEMAHVAFCVPLNNGPYSKASSLLAAPNHLQVLMEASVKVEAASTFLSVFSSEDTRC